MYIRFDMCYFRSISEKNSRHKTSLVYLHVQVDLFMQGNRQLIVLKLLE